jgi:hypothetical protein
MAIWFETRGLAALLTMREDLILEERALARVSKDNASAFSFRTHCAGIFAGISRS